MPFGELWENQQLSEYDERFKFTGKERDTETGYDYFGARYYASTLPMWLSVDPLTDKYPNISPYAYCAWNPIKYVDPDGMYFDENNEQTAQKIEERCNALLVETKDKHRKAELSKTLNDIQDMRKDSEHEFRFGQASLDENGNLAPETSYGGENTKGHPIVNMLSNIDNIDEITAHETRHGGQVARKEILIDTNGQWLNYGVRKEIDAYRAQWGWKGHLQLYVLFDGQQFGYPKSITSYYDINGQLINTIVSNPLNPKLQYPPLMLNKRVWQRN